MSGSDKKPSREKLLELEKVRQEHWRKLREAGKRSTWWMAYILWPDVFEKHYYEASHKPLCDWLDATPPGGKRGIILHREARKTMLLNVARCVRLITADPEIRIMVASAYQRTATDMCGLVKRQFMVNPNYREYYPEMAVDDPKFGRQDEFTHPMRKTTSFLDPTFFATYLGAPLISRRCDVWIGDDPVDEDMVANPDIAQNTMDKFTQVIPLVDKTSKYRQMFFIGTLKSYNDPASAIMGRAGTTSIKTDKEVVSDWEVVVRPISFIPNGDFFQGGEFAFPDENPDAKPHLPNVHTPKIIREMYDECLRNPSKGEGYWAREFCCMVQAPGDQKFQAEWFDTWVPRLPSNVVFSGLALDSAIKDEQILFRGDHSVLLVGHFDAYGHLYLTDGARSRGWKADDLKRYMVSMAENPRNMGVSNFLKEKIGEGALFALVKGWFNDARRPLTTHPLKVIGQGKKYLRITEALQGPAMGRKIHFVEGFPKDIHKAIVDEATHLGQWGHDDAIDCLSLFFHPDIRVVPMRAMDTQPVLPRMTRQPQLSTMRTVPAMLGWQAKVTASKPVLNAAGALYDPNSPWEEQIVQKADFNRHNSLDQMGNVEHIDPATGMVVRRP